MKDKGLIITVFILLLVGFMVYLAVKPVKEPNLPEPQVIDYSMEKTHQAIISTSKGEITLDLYGKLAPKTVDNFVKLANEGFYDDLRFHRVIDGFMIQGGDPNTKGGQNKNNFGPGAWGTGGPGYQFEDEFTSLLRNETGTISMANSGPNTNGSQFFINVVDNSHLNNRHTVFGRVVDGLDVADTISLVPTDTDNKPIEDVIIKSIQIKQ